MLIPWELLRDNGEEASELSARISEVAAADPLIFDEVMRGVLCANHGTNIQAVEMVEKITQVRPLFLMPYKRVLIKEVAELELVAVRRQVALLYARVRWDEWDMKQVVALLEKWIETAQDEHVIINALQSLHTLAMQKEWIRPLCLQQVQNARQHTSLLVQRYAATLQA